ncbi:MAG: FtsX-like permease family protein [Planctomycetota bacterium]|jgi:putative ABC transport system permease protein
MPLPLYYNWRNLLRRKLSTVLTFVVVAVLVLVLSVLSSFAAGIRASLAASGSNRNIMVLKPGATAESTSLMLQEEVARLNQTPDIARDAAGRPLISPELCVQTSLPRLGEEGASANVAVRGVDDVAFAVHRELRLIEGRRLEQGQLEIMVGKAARDRYANLQMNGEIALGRLSNRTFKVVGVFEAAGGALESEIWAPRSILSDAYGRRFISSAVMQLSDAPDAAKAIAYINGPAVGLDAKMETAYYEELSSKTREIIVLTTVLVGIMAIGAAFAVANTMFAAVDGRRREIAMLRTIGFGKSAIVLAFLIESTLICTAACLAGLAMSLAINGARQDFLSDTTWTVLAYELTITPRNVAAALATALAVGMAGALAPAVKASRTRVIEALRKA